MLYELSYLQPGRAGRQCEGWGSSGCEMVVFRTLRGGNKAISRITVLTFRIADFGLFSELLQRNTWDTVLETKRIQESWLIFKYPLEAPEQPISMSRRSSQDSRRPSRMKKLFLDSRTKVLHERIIYERGKQGQMTQEENGNVSDHT